MNLSFRKVCRCMFLFTYREDIYTGYYVPRIPRFLIILIVLIFATIAQFGLVTAHFSGTINIKPISFLIIIFCSFLWLPSFIYVLGKTHETFKKVEQSSNRDILTNQVCECGYSLEGLEKDTCPECGSTFAQRLNNQAFFPEYLDKSFYRKNFSKEKR